MSNEELENKISEIKPLVIDDIPGPEELNFEIKTEVFAEGDISIDAKRIGSDLYTYSNYTDCINFIKLTLNDLTSKWDRNNSTPRKSEIERFRSLKNMLIAFGFISLSKEGKLKVINWSRNTSLILQANRDSTIYGCEGVNWTINTLKNCIGYIPSRRFIFNCKFIKSLEVDIWRKEREEDINMELPSTSVE